MTRGFPRGLLLLAVGLALGGCVSLPWHPTGGPYASEAEHFSVELPKGWMRLNTEEDLLITRDGLLLQYILIERVRVDEPLKNTKKTFARGMLPQAVAEVILDNIASSQSVLDLQVKENRPVQVGGHRGFRLVYTHKNKDGLRFRSVLHGLLAGNAFYGIRYTAAERHYFAKDLRTFEQVLTSFKLAKVT
ncbi:MAG TPA: PsbP-related protein [Candidatus Methylomirabilis sp.]|jgi:hypothetical protein|nr:PsbP-related protein [Candidatus Methylomirabilis sp.]